MTESTPLDVAISTKISNFSTLARRRRISVGAKSFVALQSALRSDVSFVTKGVLTSLHESTSGGARAFQLNCERLTTKIKERLRQWMAAQVCQRLLNTNKPAVVRAVYDKFDERCIMRIVLHENADVADFSADDPKTAKCNDLAPGQDIVCTVRPETVVVSLDSQSSISSWYIEWTTSLVQIHTKADKDLKVYDALSLPEVNEFVDDSQTISMLSKQSRPCPSPTKTNESRSALVFEDDEEEERKLLLLEQAALAQTSNA